MVKPSFAQFEQDAEIKRQKDRARELRASQWWKRKCAKGVCHWCGEKTAPQDLTMDHVAPLSAGGKSTKGNLVPCCKRCNTKKHSLSVVQWARYLEEVRKKKVRGSDDSSGHSDDHGAE